jgi:hypothetical protein
MLSIKMMLTWYMLLGLTQGAVMRFNKKGPNSPSVILEDWTLRNRHTFSPSPNSGKPRKCHRDSKNGLANNRGIHPECISTQMYYKDHQRGNIADKRQAYLAAQLIKYTGDFIMNMSSDQLVPIQNNLMTITFTLPNLNTRPERQLELLLGMGATLFSMYNYINHNADSSKFSRNTQSISILTHQFEIQKDHLNHTDIEVASNRYFYLQSVKLNPAI